MPTISVAEAPHFVDIFGKEEGGVGTVGRILVKELVHRPQKPLWLTQRDCPLGAQARMQTSHQKSCGDAFPRDVAHDQPEPISTEINEIVIIAADRASLDTSARVVECSKRRQGLWEEPCLNLF